MQTMTFLMLRFGIGFSFFGHGLARLPKLAEFSAGMQEQFAKSILPVMLVKPFSYALPIAEFLVGLLLLIGLKTRVASVAGAVVMCALIFGVTTIENWEALPSQLIHLAFLALVYQFAESNRWAVDNLIGKRKNKMGF